MKISIINSGNFKLDGGALFGVVPKSIWSKKYDSDNNNMCPCNLNSLLIEEGSKKILIDCGLGDKLNKSIVTNYQVSNFQTLHNSLDSINIHESDITDVILTHLHFDHCGGCVYKVKGKLNLRFPNATHWVSETQWDTFNNPNIREKPIYFKDNILPIYKSKKLKFITKNGKLFDFLTLKIYNGHTTGMLLPFIKYKKKTFVFVSDLFPTSANISPIWLSAYDLQPLVAIQEKTLFLNEAIRNNYYLIFQHDNSIECCTVKMENGKYSINKKYKIADFDK